MSEQIRARLDVIDAAIDYEEIVIVDTLALLFDPGGQLKKREADGELVLTNRRFIFATSRHGIMIDLARKEIAVPALVSFRWTMARLTIATYGQSRHTLIVNKSAARKIAYAVNTAASS
jgi:hypothetical protein